MTGGSHGSHAGGGTSNDGRRPPGIGWSVLLLIVGVIVTIVLADARPFGIVLILLAIAGMVAWTWEYRRHGATWSPGSQAHRPDQGPDSPRARRGPRP